MNYAALKNQVFSKGEFSIVPMREEDIFRIKEWRNRQIDVLRQKKPLTDQDQKDYFAKVVFSAFQQTHPSIILFSFLKSGQCIGYGGLTNIDWESKRIELSFLVDPDIYQNQQQYEECFSVFITLIKRVVFEELHFNRIFTETYDIRPAHVAILEKNGFRPEGRMRQHVVINGKFVDSLIHGYLKEYYHA